MSKTVLGSTIRIVSRTIGVGLMLGGYIGILGAFVNAGSEVPVLNLTLGPAAFIVGLALVVFSVLWPGFRPQ